MRSRVSFRLPPGLGLALFAFWAFIILHQFYFTNPVDFKRLVNVFAPVLPQSHFAWVLVLERLKRVALGHTVVVLWGAATLGAGLVLARLVRVPESGNRGERLVLGLGLGMAVTVLL